MMASLLAVSTATMTPRAFRTRRSAVTSGWSGG